MNTIKDACSNIVINSAVARQSILQISSTLSFLKDSGIIKVGNDMLEGMSDFVTALNELQAAFASKIQDFDNEEG